MVKETITVIINVYKRPDVLGSQINAIQNQSIKCNEILIWKNYVNEKIVIPKDILKIATVAECNKNLGVWARFAYALNSKSDYICVLDDDTIPGEKWFENCINTLKQYNGLLGTRGLRFYFNDRYDPHDYFGWQNPNKKITEVDIVGHSWFFRRELLKYFWYELPSINFSSTSGEDIHFSYVLQKYANIKTFVPPHPASDKNMWGSHSELGIKYGSDENSISNKNNSHAKFNKALREYTKNGFKIYYKRNKKYKGIKIGDGLKANIFLQFMVRKHPALKKFGIKFFNILKKFKIYL